MSRVVVIGGGLAGITSALRLADAGCEVTLIEAKPWLGGLTHSFRRGDLAVDNGQHVFLRGCSAYLGLLRRLGVLDLTYLQSRLDVPVRAPGGRLVARLRRNWLPAPLHLLGTLLRYQPLSLAQRLRVARAALALRAVDRDDPAHDARSFGAWLAEQGQDARTVATLWDLVGTATLNARAGEAALSMAAVVFQDGLLGAGRAPSRDRGPAASDESRPSAGRDPAAGAGRKRRLAAAGAADIGWSLVESRRLHGDAAHARLIEAGARVVTGRRATGLSQLGSGWLVRAGASPAAGPAEYEADRVVVAVPPAAAEALLPPGCLGRPNGWARALGSSPIVNLHFVLDRTVLGEPFAAFVDSPVQWIFDRTRQSGLPAGQYLAISLSAADEYINLPVSVLRGRFGAELRRLLPAAQHASVIDFFVTREREATFRPAPGTRSLRPGVRTLDPGLFLAGAWTDTGWPATMEGAVRSGERAARAVLEQTREEVFA